MYLIVFAGLPGTGKSTLAEAVARERGFPVFAKDWLEATLRRSGLGSDPERLKIGSYAAYELLTTLAARQLHLGQSAILDSVASLERIRVQWRQLAAAYCADWRVIECTCGDETLHRERLRTRTRAIPGWCELEWSEVERVRGYYEPWQEERLVVDMARPFADNISAVLAYIGRS